MSSIRGRQVIRALLALGVGAAAIFAFWYASPARRVVEPPPVAPPESKDTLLRSPAMRYAQALQDGNCDAVMSLTWWMSERLRNAAIDPSKGSADEVRARLCHEIQDRAVENNRLRPGGVEDQYVFAPGTELEPLFVDRGREDLDQPVDDRLWVLVTYPTPTRALCDEHGRPIRSLRVGVNVSPDGLVLKASFVGNLDLDIGSISLDWETSQGE